MAVTGIILAGGKSRRMGMDKGLLKIGDKTLVEIAIINLSPLCNTVLISSNSEDYMQFGAKVVPDVIPNIGPMGGIYSSLLESRTDLNLVLSVDLPLVNEGLLAFLVEQSIGYMAAVPWSGQEHFEPLCACYNRAILSAIHDYINKGVYKMPDLFREVPTNPLIIDEKLAFYHPAVFHNINTPEDLESAKNMMNYI